MQSTLVLLAAFLVGQPQTESLGPGKHVRTLTMGEQKRSYFVHVPPRYDPKKPMPVVLVLHGAAMNGAVMEWVSGMSDKADDVPLAVNGTLMRGLELNRNMTAAGATFVREAKTEPGYRLWSIDDDHPAMARVTDGTGTAVDVEVWSVPPAGLASILLGEPPGLAIGKVRLADGAVVLGVIGEAALVEGQREITADGGWRNYLKVRRS